MTLLSQSLDLRKEGLGRIQLKSQNFSPGIWDPNREALSYTGIMSGRRILTKLDEGVAGVSVRKG